MKHFFLLSIATLTATAAFAAGPVARRQINADARIAQGFRSGELTRPEARHLDRRDDRVDAIVRHQRLDGRGLTYAERQRIEKLQNGLSRDIYRHKHDAQYR